MKKVTATAAAGLFLLALGFSLKTLFIDKEKEPLPPYHLVFEIKAERNAKPTIIFNNMYTGQFEASEGADFRQIAFTIPQTPAPLWGIRLDFKELTGGLTIRNMAVMTDQRKIIQQIDPSKHVDFLNTTRTTIQNGEIQIYPEPAPNYPILVLKGIFPLRTAVDNLPRVTPLGFASLLMILCALAAGMVIYMLLTSFRESKRTGLTIIAVFVTVFGARLLIIRYMAVSFTAWDPWTEEAWYLYLPYLDGGLSWHSMFAACNEHRIFFARVLSLGQFLLNGQWDNRFECMLTSGIYALFAAGLWMQIQHFFKQKYLCTLLVITATALPFGWENIVWGLQSQFYFFMGFSLLSLWLITVPPVLSAAWWLGAFFSLCALFTTGSGVVPAIAVAGIAVVRLIHGGKREIKGSLITLAICGIIFLFYSHIAIREHNYGMSTKTLVQGVLVFGRVMSWPLSRLPWIFIFLWSPILILSFRRIFLRQSVKPQEWFLFALAGWCVINAFGVAAFRGGFETGVISRYSDIAAMFVIVNGAAAAILAQEGIGRLCSQKHLHTSIVIWALLMMCGLISTTTEELRVRGLDRIIYQNRIKKNLVLFIDDDNLGRLMSLHMSELAYPDPMFLAACLRNETLRNFLPSSIRQPITIVPQYNSGFFQPGYRFDLYEKAWESMAARSMGALYLFKSEPLKNLRFSYLEFEVNGAQTGNNEFRKYDHNDFRLNIENRKGIHQAVSVRPSGDSWDLVTFRVTDTPSIISAADGDLFRTLTFKQPREKSRASEWGDTLINAAPLVLSIGLGLIVLLLKRKESITPVAL